MPRIAFFLIPVGAMLASPAAAKTVQDYQAIAAEMAACAEVLMRDKPHLSRARAEHLCDPAIRRADDWDWRRIESRAAVCRGAAAEAALAQNAADADPIDTTAQARFEGAAVGALIACDLFRQ